MLKGKQMTTLFESLGYIFGYLLWFAYGLVENFAVAILIFTVILRALQFPLQIKSQKSMAGNMRLQKKQQELQEKYGKDRDKLNEEISKLYEKENVSPTSGCLTTMLPMFLLFGVYYAIRNPLTNTLHIAKDSVTAALDYAKGLPVVGSSIEGYYGQISFMSIYSDVKGSAEFISHTGFSDGDISKLDKFAEGFKLFGLNLLDMPNSHGIWSVFILFPILCFVTSFATTFVSMKMNGQSLSLKGQQGCMNSMFLLMPLMSAWIAYTVPAAIGLYWIYSSVIGFITTVIIHKFYNAQVLTAQDEARRIAYLEQREVGIKQLARVTPVLEKKPVVKAQYQNKNSGGKKKKKKK